MIKEIQELIQIPSVTDAGEKGDMPYGEHVYEALKYVLNLCDKFGFRTKNCENRVGYAEIGEGDEMIGIMCHLDVMPEGKGWKYPAFGGEIHDGKLYGRGVIDDKGPAIMTIYAMKELLESGMELHKRIRIIFGCQEESGDWLDMQYYQEHEEHPTYGFTPDADFPLIYGEKGIMNLKFTQPLSETGFTEIEGGDAPNMVADYVRCVMDGKTYEAKGVSAHGSMPECGENAITKLMEQLDCPFADFYMKKIGYALHGENMNAEFEDEASGKVTYNVGTIGVVDDQLEMVIDTRFPVTYKPEEMVAIIEESIKGYGIKVEMDKYMKPVYMDKNGDVIQTLLSAYQEVTGDMETEPAVIGGGTYARALDNIVAFGPMLPGRELTEHQPNEYMFVEDIEKAKEIYKLALQRLLEL